MKSVFATTACLIVLLGTCASPGALAQDKAGGVAAAAVETVVTVVDVDRESRTVTVMGPSGRLVSIDVPPEAQNLDQVHAGAHFKVAYLASVVIALSKGSGDVATSSSSKSVRLAPKGDIPGGMVVHTVQANAVVEKIDRDNRTVTVRGVEGGPQDLQVDESVKAFDDVEVGDIVTLQFTRGLAMRMIPQ